MTTMQKTSTRTSPKRKQSLSLQFNAVAVPPRLVPPPVPTVALQRGRPPGGGFGTTRRQPGEPQTAIGADTAATRNCRFSQDEMLAEVARIRNELHQQLMEMSWRRQYNLPEREQY